jgi:NADH:ubiquinone oxidoreductase subunit 6 (subunit J)
MVYDVILVVLTLISAFLAAQFKEILHAIAAFLVMSIVVALVFFWLGAYYVGVFQILIYVGAIVVLLLISFHTIER